MIQSGQIRGRIFIDNNDNGKLDRGEQGVEGVTIKLTPGDIITVSSAFGQFAFDELSPGGYKFKLTDNDYILQWPASVMIDDDRVVINTPDNLLQKIDIPVKKRQ